MPSNQEFLAIEGVGLQVGQTRRIVCPWCMGGGSGETSMNLTRKPEGLAYTCHRASCAVRGFVGGLPVLPTLDAPARRGREYTGPVLPLTPQDLNYFEDRYELSEDALRGHIYRSYDGRYVLPIVWRGEERGYVLRRPWEGAPVDKPWKGIKSDVYMDDPDKVQHSLYEHRGNAVRNTVVIVEDQLSAMKVAEASTDLYGVALLGSLLNLDKVREIQRLKAKEVIIALDSDATSTSLSYARQFGQAFSKCRVAILERDLKDTKLADIPTVLSL